MIADHMNAVKYFRNFNFAQILSYTNQFAPSMDTFADKIGPVLGQNTAISSVIVAKLLS
jgi:hypothetical protein